MKRRTFCIAVTGVTAAIAGCGDPGEGPEDDPDAGAPGEGPPGGEEPADDGEMDGEEENDEGDATGG